MQGSVWIPQAHDTNSIILSCTYFSSLHFFSTFLFSSLPSSSFFSLHPIYYDWLNIEQVSDWPLGFLNIGMFAPPANINTSSSPFFRLIVCFIPLIKRFQVMYMGKFDLTHLNFGYEYFLRHPVLVLINLVSFPNPLAPDPDTCQLGNPTSSCPLAI